MKKIQAPKSVMKGQPPAEGFAPDPKAPTPMAKTQMQTQSMKNQGSMVQAMRGMRNKRMGFPSS